MAHYTIYNKDRNVDLIHPKVGLWNTDSLEEARSCRDACRNYLVALGLAQLCESIVVRDVETKEEIL